mgnify:CR=1 FL=1
MMSSECVVVKRTGKPPLRFYGDPLFTQTSYRSGPHLWYDVSLFHRPKGGFVVDVKCYKKDSGAADMFRGVQADTIGDVLDYLESYDAAADLDVDSLSGENSSEARLRLRELELRRAVLEAQRQFALAVTPILEDLVESDRQSR